MRANKWLITGGCGFIGSNLVSHILRENPEARIRIIDNFSVGTREDLMDAISLIGKDSVKEHNELEIIEGDIRNYDICLKSCDEIDVVVHLAASTGVAPSVENPGFDMETNVIGTFNMLESARKCKVEKFIFASSSAPIGDVDPPIHEEKAPKPVSPYGASKLAGEAYCSAYYRTFGLKTISLRFGNVYGPLSRHKDSVVAKFIKQALAGETLVIYGDGNQTRDFIYIEDLIQAIMLSVKSDVGGEVFQIATFKETTVNEIARKIAELAKTRLGINVNIIHGDARPGDVKRNYSDISKAMKTLGYSPKYDLDTGLTKTFEYFLFNTKK